MSASMITGLSATSPPAARARPPKGSRTRRQTDSPKPSPSKKKPDQAARSRTKQDLVIQLLRRQSGVSIDDLASETDWQPHSVRGFLSAVVRKKLKLPLVSEVGKDGVRRYHIALTVSSEA
jgi:hypothetical protein